MTYFEISRETIEQELTNGTALKLIEVVEKQFGSLEEFKKVAHEYEIVYSPMQIKFEKGVYSAQQEITIRRIEDD